MSKLRTAAIAAVLALSAVRADADGRSVMFLKGVAYGVAQECPKLSVDADGVRSTKRIAGNSPGDFFDFMDGMTSIVRTLKRGEETCDSICAIRPGTCYFVNERPQ